MLNKFLLLFVNLLFLFVTYVSADGPKKIARINRALWPYEINSVQGFDFASKMEMLVFAEVFAKQELLTQEDSVKKYLGFQNIKLSSIESWKAHTKELLINNFGKLTLSPNDFIELKAPYNWVNISKATNSLELLMPDNLKAWYKESTGFYQSYVYEQMRLAALFPKTTSEILNLQPSEINGNDYQDKHFLLTFDDGPTPANGHTDKLIATLNQHKKTGIFFVLGDMLHARSTATSVPKVHDLYSNMVVGSHGKVHKSHQKYQEWQSSILFTAKLIDSIVPENKKTQYFRPPYGQRTDEVISYLDKLNDKVMLWNIDSQDWNANISSTEVADRIITLMLLWRKGIILFHDIHPKVNIALPIIWKNINDAGIVYIDPKKL